MPLSSLVGNREAREALLLALANQRLPHALLLHGPAGVGKLAAAEALAQALLCPSASPDACGTCNTCRRVAEGIHPDLRRLERDGQFIKIDPARELVRESFLRPYEGRAKVFLVPEAERFNEESGNALLKTLEEPPASTYLILVTASREALLATIRSRCQAIAFRSLGRAELRRLLEQEHGLDPAEADLRSRLGAGSRVRAMELDLDRMRAERRRLIDLLDGLAAGRLGGTEADELVALAEAGARKPEAIEHLLLGTLRGLARDALVLAEGGSPELLLHIDEAEAIGRLARRLGPDAARALLEDTESAERDLRLNANKKLLVEAILCGVHQRATGRSWAPAGSTR